MDEKRGFNPLNPMRQNRWRKWTQKVRRGSDPLKGAPGPVAEAPPAASIPRDERPREPS
jgi:hypothetical protein